MNPHGLESDIESEGKLEGEINQLTRALHLIDRRLEELTGGAVDTVADGSGFSYVLLRAQEQARSSEAEKQAAILNALPAHVVLLDAGGVILTVNESWRRLAVINGAAESDCGVAENYLTVCDRASADGLRDAAKAAAGIRSVLQGYVSKFTMEYACDSATEKRTFLLIVTPVDEKSPMGAVVMHLNITDQKRDEEATQFFAAAMKAVTDGIILVDRASMRVIQVNDAACQLYVRDRRRMLAMRPWELVGLSAEQAERLYDDLIGAGGATQPMEYLWRRDDGSAQWVEFRRQAQLVANRWMIVIMVRDITVRKESEARIVYLNRVHAVLSGINSLIVRVHGRAELFAEACRVAVEAGGFPMAWIGMVDAKLDKLVPTASAGIDADFLAAIAERIVLNPHTADEHSMAWRAMHEQQPVFSNDVLKESRVFIFRDKYAIYGIQSVIILPLIVTGESVGVLVLYVKERDFFQPDEVRLLTELAGDVVFAIDHIDKQERLDFLAWYDTLTGLPNRSLLLERLSQHMRWAAGCNRKLALFLIDLERFKDINDSLGRPAGDSLLQQLALWLSANSNDSNSIARLASDHFALFMEIEDEEGVTQFLEPLLQKLSNHAFRLNDAVYRIAAKVGVAIYPDDGGDADTLFKNAEAALKKAKVAGDRYLVYAQKMTQTVAGRLGLENQLRQAIDRREFVLHYQPKLHATSLALVGAEALIRWNDPRTGLVMPQRFIRVLEDTGLIHEVGRWALRQAMEDSLRWRSISRTPVRIAVNVSPIQLRDRHFVEEINRAISLYPGAAAAFELEITESVIMEDVAHSITILNSLRSMGVRIAVDDFGTGFSSLSYLTRLPVDALKIDRSFVADMARPEGLSLVSIIINLAHSLKLNVVAEGVETQEQLHRLRLLNCDEVQGYLFSVALPTHSFETKYLLGADKASVA